MARFVSVVLVSLFVTAVGCSRGDAPATAPVKGVVTMAGKPLASVGVTFLPTGPGPIASGNTNEKRIHAPYGPARRRGVIGTHKVVLGTAEEGRGSRVSRPFPQI
jgi:hypothetical protein